MMKSGKAATKKASAAGKAIREPKGSPEAGAPESEIDRLGTMSIGEL